jgi:signal transduction histidine kinase
MTVWVLRTIRLQKGGSGLRNIVNRAALIGAVAVIDSAPGKGCCIKITIDPLRKTGICQRKPP